MRANFLGIIFVGFALTAATVHADTADCAGVVDATVAEMKAGAGDKWTEEAEQRVRAAAGAACIKSVSGRYSKSADDRNAMVSEPVAAGAAAAEPAVGNAASASAVTPEAGSAEREEEEEGTTVGGITFRPLSGNPNKKSFERKRSTDND